MKLRINYCDASGMMARCTAKSCKESNLCGGYMKHSTSDKCSWCNEPSGYVCGNWEQAEVYNQIGIVRAEDAEFDSDDTAEIDLSEFDDIDLGIYENVIASCANCSNEPGCASVKALVDMKAAQGDVCGNTEFVLFAAGCPNYTLRCSVDY